MTTSTEVTAKRRRMARTPQPTTNMGDLAQAQSPARERKPSKLDRMQAMLLREDGASIAEIMLATDWQQHSIRGAMAGALKKRGLAITIEKIDGLRRYRASKAV
jgi:hypothetical protein